LEVSVRSDSSKGHTTLTERFKGSIFSQILSNWLHSETLYQCLTGTSAVNMAALKYTYSMSGKIIRSLTDPAVYIQLNKLPSLQLLTSVRFFMNFK
jgi:hypothetical protein